MVLIHTLPLGFTQAYLLEFDAGMILVDAGVPGSKNRILAKMAAINREDLRLILITHAHYDHYGSAAALRRLTGAPVAIHLYDRDAMARGETSLGAIRGRGRIVRPFLPVLNRLVPVEPTKADVILEDGDSLEEFGINAFVLHTPGHTMGSISLIVEGRYAFVGDLISTNGKPHPQCLFAHDWSLVADSLTRLKLLEPDWVFAGHGNKPLDREGLLALTIS
ncbi:MAG: MBL fold metallo-hydrolase [Anaerolineales bacterium]|nr:MBL fold metallo-hydrolase [Anaerolineales bacterium]